MMFRTVSPGQPVRPPSASERNRLNQAARGYHREKYLFGPLPSRAAEVTADDDLGQYAGQQRMMVTSNAIGFDFDWLLPDP